MAVAPFAVSVHYPTRAGPLPEKMLDTTITAFDNFLFGMFQKYKTQSYYTTPIVAQKNLYMCLLLGVDVC